MELVSKSNSSIKFRIKRQKCELQEIYSDLGLNETIISRIEITNNKINYLIINYENSTIIIHARFTNIFLRDFSMGRHFDYYIYCLGDIEIMKPYVMEMNYQILTKIFTMEHSINYNILKYCIGFYNFIITSNNKIHNDLFIRDSRMGMYRKRDNKEHEYNKDYYNLFPLINKIRTINELFDGTFNLLIINNFINKNNNEEIQSIFCNKIMNFKYRKLLHTVLESSESLITFIRRKTKLQISINDSLTIINQESEENNNVTKKNNNETNKNNQGTKKIIFDIKDYKIEKYKRIDNTRIYLPFNFQICSDETQIIRMNMSNAWKQFEYQIVNKSINSLKILTLCESMIKFSDLCFELHSKWFDSYSNYDSSFLVSPFGIMFAGKYAKRSSDNCLKFIKNTYNPSVDLTDELLNDDEHKEFFMKISNETEIHKIRMRSLRIHRIIQHTYNYCRRIS